MFIMDAAVLYEQSNNMQVDYILFAILGQVRSECLTCTFRATCCSARLSRAQGNKGGWGARE